MVLQGTTIVPQQPSSLSSPSAQYCYDMTIIFIIFYSLEVLYIHIVYIDQITTSTIFWLSLLPSPTSLWVSCILCIFVINNPLNLVSVDSTFFINLHCSHPWYCQDRVSIIGIPFSVPFLISYFLAKPKKTPVLNLFSVNGRSQA